MRPTRLVLAVAAAVVATVLAGCSSAEEPAATNASEVPVQSEPDARAEEDDDEQEGSDDEEQKRKALASVTVPVSFVDGAEVLAEVLEFSAADELVRMTMRFTASLPSGTEKVALGAVLERNENAPGAAVQPELVDTTNLKAYEPVLGGTRSGSSLNLSDGVPVELVYYYATPEDPVDTVDVVLAEQAPSLLDVPFRP
jgi:hypothetical protein